MIVGNQDTISDCYKGKNKLRYRRRKDQGQTNVVASKNKPVEMHMLQNFEPNEINLTMNSRIGEWILDFGTSLHVTSNKYWFDHLHESNH